MRGRVQSDLASRQFALPSPSRESLALARSSCSEGAPLLASVWHCQRTAELQATARALHAAPAVKQTTWRLFDSFYTLFRPVLYIWTTPCSCEDVINVQERGRGSGANSWCCAVTGTNSRLFQVEKRPTLLAVQVDKEKSNIVVGRTRIDLAEYVMTRCVLSRRRLFCKV